jgi:hypothetical protein
LILENAACATVYLEIDEKEGKPKRPPEPIKRLLDKVRGTKILASSLIV